MGVRLFTVLVLTFLTVKCEFKDSPQELETGPVVLSFADESLSTTILPLPEPDHYAVDVSWKKVDLDAFLKLKTDYEFTQIPKSKNSHRLEMPGGSLFDILIEWRTPEGSVIESRTIRGEVPSDLIFDGTTTLTENRKFTCGRIYLNKGSALQVREFHLDLNCNELISEDGLIESFPAGAVFPVRGGGARSGGNVNIKVQRVRGNLKVAMRGESGGHGRDGISARVSANFPVPGCKGQDGGSGGATGSFQLVAGSAVQYSLRGSLEMGYGGKAGNGHGKGYEIIRPGGFNRDGEMVPCVFSFRQESGQHGLAGAVGKICAQIGSAPNNCDVGR